MAVRGYSEKRASQFLLEVYCLIAVSNLSSWQTDFAAVEISTHMSRMVLSSTIRDQRVGSTVGNLDSESMVGTGRRELNHIELPWPVTSPERNFHLDL